MAAIDGSILEATELHLASHMILEHSLFFAIGAISVLAAELMLKWLTLSSAAGSDARHTGTSFSFRHQVLQYWSMLLRSIFGNVHGLLWIAIAVVLMAFWHMPRVFDLASFYGSVHIIQHISFIIVGAAGFIATRAFGDSFRIALLVTIISMMGFSGLVFAVLNSPVYTGYSVTDHNAAGNYMIITSIVVLLIGLPAYLINRTLSYAKAFTRE